MKILVAFAAEVEFAPWRRLRGFRATQLNGHLVHEARIQDVDVRVVLTGVGLENARRVMRMVMSNWARVCISSGLAGSLRAEHRCGAILAARLVREADSQRVIESAPGLLEYARERGAKRVDAFLTRDRILVAAEEKRKLGQSADAVEMESFSVLAEALAHGVRAVAIRAISDSVDEDLRLDFNRVFDAQGRLALPQLAKQLAVRPHRLPALVRLGWRSSRAATALAAFLDGYVQNLPDEPPGILLRPPLEVASR